MRILWVCAKKGSWHPIRAILAPFQFMPLIMIVLTTLLMTRLGIIQQDVGDFVTRVSSVDLAFGR
jgi:hypothetical protein